ncbi:MAG: hypothetical protein IBJ18_13410 [Phycisphaerales bacterium]|nr:hypothetical protein [Phycisphaerales bacterium]
MEIAAWIGIASVVVAIGSALFAWFQAQAAKEQAQAARVQADAARSQAISAEKQVELMKQQVEVANDSNRIAKEMIEEEKANRSLNIDIVADVEEGHLGPWLIVTVKNNSRFPVHIQHAYAEFEDGSRENNVYWDGQIDFMNKNSQYVQFLPGTMPSFSSCRFRFFRFHTVNSGKLPPDYSHPRWRKLKNLTVVVCNQTFIVNQGSWLERITKFEKPHNT